MDSNLSIDDQYNSYKDFVTQGKDRPLTTMEKHGFTFAQQDFIGNDKFENVPFGQDIPELQQPTEWSDEQYQRDLKSMNQGNNTGYTWLPNLTEEEQFGKFMEFVTHGKMDRVLTKEEGEIFKALMNNSGEYRSVPRHHNSNVGQSKSIMYGNAYGTRPIGTQGVFGDAIDATFGMDEIKAGEWDWLLGNTETGGAPGAWTSNLLDVLNIPSNLITEGVEYFGERGDKEFNFSDAMPGFSGDFSFTNMHGEPTKTVSQTTDAQGNPLVENFLGWFGNRYIY